MKDTKIKYGRRHLENYGKDSSIGETVVILDNAYTSIWCPEYVNTDAKVLRSFESGGLLHYEVEAWDGAVFEIERAMVNRPLKFYEDENGVVQEKVAAKCDCGAEKTWGVNCSVSFHSSWCSKSGDMS